MPSSAGDGPAPVRASSPAPAKPALAGVCEQLCVCRRVEVLDWNRVVAAARDVPGRGHGEMGLEHQEATCEREAG